jgi:hypothetical protein
MIPDNLTIPAAVIGMAVLTVVAAGLFSSYQRGQAYKRLRLQRLLLGAHHAEDLLERLVGVSLPRDIRVLLRQDIHDRYRLVARLHSRYPEVDKLITQSEQRRAAEGSDVGKVLPVPKDYATFEQWQSGFGELLAIIQMGGLLKPLPANLRQRYRVQLLERHAECLYGHFMNQADKCKTDDRPSVARSQIQQLTERLRALGVKTDRTQELLAQAEEAYQYLLTGATPAEGSPDVGAAQA